VCVCVCVGVCVCVCMCVCAYTRARLFVCVFLAAVTHQGTQDECLKGKDWMSYFKRSLQMNQ